MTVDVQVRVGRVRRVFPQIRRGLLGAGAAVWAVGCVYRTLPVPDAGCHTVDFGGVSARSLLIVEIVTGVVLLTAILVTERAAPWASLGVVWPLFALLVLQDAGIAPFGHYINVHSLSDSAFLAVPAMWFATTALGVAGLAHTAAVVGTGLRGRSVFAAPPSRTRIPLSLLVGAVVGLCLSIPICVSVWDDSGLCYVEYDSE
ncbi:hypothetical protein ACFXHA_43840 [Nocardia sp. NPDC059240]|uniref:hypothetical protein n=1 Tax=Nocardia sp. NPDC059240 TaxID=3346786 RepID=UPI0036A5F747